MREERNDQKCESKKATMCRVGSWRDEETHSRNHNKQSWKIKILILLQLILLIHIFNTSWEEVDVGVFVPFSGHLYVEYSLLGYIRLPISCVFNNHIFNLKCNLDLVWFDVHLEMVILFHCVIAVFKGYTRLFQIDVNIWDGNLNWTEVLVKGETGKAHVARHREVELWDEAERSILGEDQSYQLLSKHFPHLHRWSCDEREWPPDFEVRVDPN